MFKQKTAYEMRISDWSSDVCSSDLLAPGFEQLVAEKAHPAEIVTIQPMVLPPSGQRGTGHVQIDHVLGATGDRRDGKAAGVGEQVEHPLALRLFLHPTADITHVEKQAVVLLAPEIELVAQTVLDDQLLGGHIAQHRRGRCIRQIAMLQQQALCLALLPEIGRAACRESRWQY